MISPPSASSRRIRYSRSPDGGDAPSSKRSKASNSSDPYDRDHAQHRPYTSICVKNINPKISDLEIRDLCNKKFSKYGNNSVKIYHRNQERVAFVNFTNCEDARKARHAKTGLVWENMQVLLEPVYYRKTVPAEQPIKPSTPPRERSPPARRPRRPSPSPSPPPASSRSRSHHQSSSSSRHQYANSPPRSSRPPPRRVYSPYIPLPPDLVDYASKGSSRQRQHSSPSPSPVRRHQHKQTSRQKHSPSPNNHRSPSSSPVPHRSNSDAQQEPTRMIVVENLERDITESKLKDLFARYGTIDEIDLKKPSSKRAYAFIQYENLDMAFAARRGMNGQLIGKAECKITYGKTVPSKYLWIGNIPIGIKRRDLEHAFSRYGVIKSLDYSTGDLTAVVTYMDVEDAVRARSKLMGTTQIIDGRIVRNKSDLLYRDGFRIDYLDHPTSRRFVIVRPQQQSSNQRESRSPPPSPSPSRHSSPASSTQHRTPSPSNDLNHDPPLEDNLAEEIKIETHSHSPTPPITNPIKERRSTDHSETLSLSSPIAGRTFHPPLGSYLSSNDTAHITNINDLMILCEQLNSSATQNNTALSTVYPVQFILKSHAYDARMHFLAGSPTLASLLLGQPGDLVAAKTELKITQRLRFDPHRLEDLERKLRTNVTNTLEMNSNDSIGSTNRKHRNIPNQAKFALLLASTKTQMSNGVPKPIKSEVSSPKEIEEIKQENIDEDDQSILSSLISYLNEKEAAGLISIPFYPTYHTDYSTGQETAVLYIIPSSAFTQKLLKLICPSIHFSMASHDEHLMVIIVHND